jgi:hypothetical protein
MNYEIGRTPRILVGSEHLSSLAGILKNWERASAVLIVDAVIAGGEYIKTLKEPEWRDHCSVRDSRR